jgi:ketosteroid isomerase-like protein
MPDPNVALIRWAYAAYESGDTAVMLNLIDPDLEWTYLDPSAADPRPQVCHGRGALQGALAQQARRGLRAQLEEVIGHGDTVVVAARPQVQALTVAASPTTVTTPCSPCATGESSPCATAAIVPTR